MNPRFRELSEAVRLVEDGGSIAMGKLFPMALVREIIRQRKRGLHLIGMPISGLAADLLVAAGAVSAVESGAVTLGSHGAALNFQRAVAKAAARRIRSSCSIIVAGLVGGAAGMPFVAIPGVLGSDLLETRPDLIVHRNPYEPDANVVLAPAIRPDVALVHAVRADLDGNLVVSALGDEALMARAAHATIATVERIDERALESLSAEEEIIPAVHVHAIVQSELATHPFAGHDGRGADNAAIAAYLAASASDEAMAAYIEATILAAGDEAGYRKAVS